ncbi:unnamed protein product [Arabidopsis halleri]
MECASSDVNDLSNVHLHNRQRTDDNTRLAMLDLDFLDCPICVEPFTIPIFQCDNGHLACSSCCPKLSYKCPSCALPIGHNRCRAMESVLESILIPCSNAKLGCTKNVSYGKESTHEKECIFSLCFCPIPNCNHRGLFKDLYSHFDVHRNIGRDDSHFAFGKYMEIRFGLSETPFMVMKEYKEGLLFVVQCHSKAQETGLYVTVSCISIAPSSLEVGNFSCHISTTVAKRTILYTSMKVKNTQKLSFKIPQEDFMFIPSYILGGYRQFELEVCVSKLNH